jgi:glutathione S-transferase
MADLIFYTNPQSRGRIVRWMLEEVGTPYETEIVPYDQMKSERYLAVNPMGKVPAIRHGEHVVTECAAICAYLADVFPQAGLGPRDDVKADYYRWLFYAAGPVEAAVSNKAMGWEPTPERERMFGYGNFDRVVAVLDELFSLRDYVCGDRFTGADVYLGSQIMFPLQFGQLPERDSLLRYRDRLQGRDAYKRAAERDDEAQQQMQPAQSQPAQPQPAQS